MAERPRSQPVRIERMVPGGLSLGHLEDGRVVLLSGGLPGDLVEFRADSSKKSLVRGKTLRVLHPSPDRGPRECEYVERCGGCPLLPLTREGERAAKLSIVEQALARTGKLPFDHAVLERSLVSQPERVEYRTRLRFQHRAGALGFFERESNSLVEVERCRVGSSELNELLLRTRAKLKQVGSGLEAIEGLELSVFPRSPERVEAPAERSSLAFYGRTSRGRRLPTPGELEAFAELGHVQVVDLDRPAIRAGNARASKYWILSDLFLRIEPGSFSQVNPSINRRLVQAVLDVARTDNARSFLDLFGGAGNFTLPLLAHGLTGTLVELHAGAVQRAQAAAKEQGLGHAEFVAADVVATVRTLEATGQRYDLVILDPPRAGAGGALLPALRLAQKSLILVGCEPTAWARDLKTLLDHGARLREIVPFDMFPGTHHIELLACLEPPSLARHEAESSP